jgi:hypothetical protein
VFEKVKKGPTAPFLLADISVLKQRIYQINEPLHRATVVIRLFCFISLLRAVLWLSRIMQGDNETLPQHQLLIFRNVTMQHALSNNGK